MQDKTIIGQRITYEYAKSPNLSDHERAICETAIGSIENSMAVLAEIQAARTGVDGSIERAPTRAELGTVAEMAEDLERSIVRLTAFNTRGEMQ